MSRSASTQSKVICFHIMEMFAFTFPEVLLMMTLCAMYFPSALANFATFIICCYLTSNYWLPSAVPEPTTNVRLSIPASCDRVQIEIGGAQHSNNWKRNLQYTIAKALKTESLLYNFKTLKIDILVHCQSPASLDTLSKVVNMLLPENGVALPRTPNLELNVEIIQNSSIQDAKDTYVQPSLDLHRLGNLQKLTWKGSYPHFLLAPPRYRDYWDMLFDRKTAQTEVKYSRLIALNLIDSELAPSDLVEILSRCPLLASCEVRQLGRSTKNVGPTHAMSEVEPRQCPESTPLTLLALRHFTITSSLDLSSFFTNVRLPNIESISLHISRSTPMMYPIHEHISRLKIQWSTMRYFELVAPLDYYSIRYLKAFFDMEPSLYGRTHSLSDDRLH